MKTEYQRVLTSPAALTVALIVVAVAATPSFAEPYWFERYQRAIELIEDGEAIEASPILDDLIVHRPRPMVAVRLPGSLYIDYLPYYQQARARLQQGDAEAAAINLDLSLSYGQVTASRRHTRGLEELRQGLEDARLMRTAQMPVVSELR